MFSPTEIIILSTRYWYHTYNDILCVIVFAYRTLCFLTIFSQYLRKVSISLPIYSSTKGFIRVRFKVFALFSVRYCNVLSTCNSTVNTFNRPKKPNFHHKNRRTCWFCLVDATNMKKKKAIITALTVWQF